MNLPNRQLLLGTTLGAICATALSAVGPGWVFADEPASSIDPDALVRIEDRVYSITHEDWVATDPISRSRVKKVGYGNISYVDISTTATGTYSTDGFASPHVLYPGIEVDEASPVAFAPVLLLDMGQGWVAAPLSRGSSFIHLRLDKDERVYSNGTTTCFLSRDYTLC